jgi:hypothetical protein
MRKLILSLTLILIGFCAWAQTDFLITIKSDTLRGEIRLLSYDKIDRIQISTNGKKETYTAMQVLNASIKDVTYKPIQKDNTVRMMQVLKKGYLSLYAFNYPNQFMFDGRYLVKLDGATLEVPNLSFKKIMANFLEDCVEVSEKVKKGEWGKSDINTIIDEYNVCVSNLKPAPIPATVTTSEELNALKNLTAKINDLNFDTKADALDILKDMQSKLEKKEKVSNYLIGGLEAALKDQATVTEDLTKLTDLLKKN